MNQFGFGHKNKKLKVMSLLDKIVKKDTAPVVDPNQLNAQELQLALNLLKQSTIRGEQVEVFYNLVVKLQSQFIIQTQN